MSLAPEIEDHNAKMLAKDLIGFKKKDVEKRNLSVHKTDVVIGPYRIPFEIEMGNLVVNGTFCETTYLIEINNMEGYKKTHAGKHRWGGHGKQLSNDYSEAARKAVFKFCKENNLKIIDYFCSWPKFQAMAVPAT